MGREPPEGTGDGGARAARSGQACVVRDVLRDPNYATYLDMAREMQFNACASFPLLVDGKIEGALVIYACNDTFGEVECGLLEDLARDIGHAIAALRAEAGRNEAEAALRRNEALPRACRGALPCRQLGMGHAHAGAAMVR
ncbi:MAG: GAF domain-containing protein [Rhodocyclaceae bacterium]|nr:GAF domain-containing protein [Rhodocyclaceae bacterium]